MKYFFAILIKWLACKLLTSKRKISMKAKLQKYSFSFSYKLPYFFYHFIFLLKC